MTREEKCKLAIKKGYTYNSKTGNIIGIRGKEITRKINDYIQIWLTDEDNKKHTLSGHQFGWYWVNKECVEQIDHINGIKDDNRISNLRSVNILQNQWNQTKAKGYYFKKQNNMWCSQISVNNKKIFIGYFKNEEDARASYLIAKEKYHKII